jgi:hypothetical protein
MKKLIRRLSFLCCLSSNAWGDEVKLSTPEETLDTYINALREGDLKKVSTAYYLIVDFHLPSHLKIGKYQIIQKKIFDTEDAGKYEPIPKAKTGDVEFIVIEEINGKNEKYTYLLRCFDKEWKIISHSSWSQPD